MSRHMTAIDMEVLATIRKQIEDLSPNRINRLEAMAKKLKIEAEELFIYFFLSTKSQPLDKFLRKLIPEYSLDDTDKNKLLSIISNNEDFQLYLSTGMQYFTSEDESLFYRDALVPKIFKGMSSQEKKIFNKNTIYLFLSFCQIRTPYCPDE